MHHGRGARLSCRSAPDGEAVGTCLGFRAVSEDSQVSPALIWMLLAVRLAAGEPVAVGGDKIVGAFLGPPQAGKSVEAFVAQPEPVTCTVEEITGTLARKFREWAVDHADDFR